ncbi:hypothetical protein EDB81DRAFT_723438 [Dactylonectria macrodidyma]|uniref:NmrA-like domain-containing protein n=1 Tax=Dactylonectria macrodidyma TaxID=307937 RepID=A0A9P9ERC0_9HYPO|nr:hypothetical protein EDB81DRAFT_723438 [Dactylonectria macrodidyma]
MPLILVVGATGQQGGAVTNALLASGHNNLKIRALTRNPSSAASKALADRNVELARGDLLDGDSLLTALTGCGAAYLVTDFRGEGDVAGEIKQGKLFTDKAKEANVKHLVFSSVAGADIAQAVEYFYSKFQIEEYIKASGLSWTFLRPSGLMEVLPPAGVGRAFMLGAFAATLRDVAQPYVACEDIGRMIAKAIREPDNFKSKIIDLAGDRVNVDQLQAALGKAEGTRSWRVWLPRWLVLALSPYHYRQMFKWLGLGVQPGDPSECQQILGSVLSVEEWARKQKTLADSA